jgi:hypothetical protein
MFTCFLNPFQPFSRVATERFANQTSRLLLCLGLVFTNPGDFNDQSWAPEYLPYVWLEYPNAGAREK